ncbi:MAG: hypothetical protein ACR2PT_21700 [Endozoicomonas sp.]
MQESTGLKSAVASTVSFFRNDKPTDSQAVFNSKSVSPFQGVYDYIGQVVFKLAEWGGYSKVVERQISKPEVPEEAPRPSDGSALAEKVKSFRSSCLTPMKSYDTYENDRDTKKLKEALTGFLQGRLTVPKFVRCLQRHLAKGGSYFNTGPTLHYILSQYYKSNIEGISYRDWVDRVLCQLTPAMIASAFPAELTANPVCTDPIAKDAPVNLMWVGQLLPETYRLAPVEVARRNPDREVVLWYYSGCLSEQEKKAMATLADSEEYKQHNIKVLDLARLDEARLFPSLPDTGEIRNVSLNDTLKKLMPEGASLERKHCLMAADFARHFLMAAGSDAIDQLVTDGNKERSSTGMVYMDLDGIKSFQVITGQSQQKEHTEYQLEPLSNMPLSDVLEHPLPTGLCSFYHARGQQQIDHGFLGVNSRENPIFLQSILKEENKICDYLRNCEFLATAQNLLPNQRPAGLQALYGEDVHQQDAALLISDDALQRTRKYLNDLQPESITFWPFLDSLAEGLKVFGLDRNSVAKSFETMLHCAAFHGDLNPETFDHTVQREGVEVNVDLTPIKL